MEPDEKIAMRGTSPSSPSRMMLPFPNCFSIALTAAPSAFIFSPIFDMLPRAPAMRAVGMWPRRRRGSSRAPVERAVLHCLGQVAAQDPIRAHQVGDGARPQQDAVVRPRREPELL